MHIVKNDNGDIAAVMIPSLNSVFRETMDGDDDDDDGRNKHVRTETPARRNKNHKLETALEGISQVRNCALATIT
jgi:hypothetical protein